MITPQAAFELAHGRARIPTFVEMARPGPQRPMPAVAGMQRSQVEAMIASSGPPVGRPAGPQQTPITQPAGVNGLAAGGCIGCTPTTSFPVRKLAGLGSPSTWPTWIKIVVPLVIVLGVGGAIYAVHRHRKSSSDFDFGFDD